MEQRQKRKQVMKSKVDIILRFMFSKKILAFEKCLSFRLYSLFFEGEMNETLKNECSTLSRYFKHHSTIKPYIEEGCGGLVQ